MTLKPTTPATPSVLRRIKVKHYINSAFKEFSLYDNVRSIPSMLDGFKPAQRKAIYGVQVRGENAAEIQVERLAAHVAAVTDYHHGTTSMEGTIISMANNYPGTNNMNFFVPSGQFGSRLTKEAAAGRYIFTKFDPNFRSMFKKEDDIILENNISDGEKIEPKFYIPLLPTVLINGAQGTGTGHASFIMNYNPNHIKEAILKYLSNDKLVDGKLLPWYKGFTGKIERNKDTGQVVIRGILAKTGSTTIQITELPVGVYLDQYKEVLAKLEETGLIKDYEDRSTEDGFDFVVTVPRTTTAMDQEVLMQKFKLISRDTENYTLWNENGIIEKYNSVEHIIRRFADWRLQKYEERRQALIAEAKAKVSWLKEKQRFIQFYLSNTENFKSKKKQELIDLLTENKFIEYDKLLQMPIWSLTRDRIDELKKQIADEETYLKSLENDNARDMYKRELQSFVYVEK